MRKTSKRSTKKLAFFLAILMVFCSIPIEGFAIYDPSIIDSDNETYDCPKSVNVTQETDPVLILHEEADLREESVKHYRMSDGSFTAVQYDESIHYEDGNGEWKDIDNTLKAVSSSKEIPVFENTESDVSYSFEGTPGNGQIVAKYNDYSVSFGYIDDTLISALNNDEVEINVNDDAIDADPSDNETAETDSETYAAAEKDVKTVMSEVIEDPEFAAINDESENNALEIEDVGAEAPTELSEADVSADDTSFETVSDVISAPDDTVRSYTIEISNPQGTSPYESEGKRGVSDKSAENSDGTVVPYTLEEANDRIKVSSEIKYVDPADGFAFKYDLMGRDLKESIIINTAANEYTYKFGFNPGSLMPELTDEGSVLLSDDVGNAVFEIAAPYMFDENDEISFDVKYKIEKNDEGGYVLSVIADPAWINAEERAFPVTIDPTLTVKKNGSTAPFTLQYRLGTGQIYTNNQVHRLGQNNTNKYISTLYINNSNLPVLPNNTVPIMASVYFFQYGYAEKSGNSDQLIVAVREAADKNYWYNNTTANNIIDYQRIDNSQKWRSWNITEAVQKWYEDETSNNGIIFTSETVFSGSNWAYGNFCGNNSIYGVNSLPFIAIRYINNVGLEGYYSYLTQDVGRAGGGYVRVKDGAFTFVRNDVANSGIAQGFTLSHIFNSAYANYKFLAYTEAEIHTKSFGQMITGYGWKLNVQQTVVSQTVSGTNYKVYVDEDGTEHYFYLEAKENESDPDVYRDEEGLGLKISAGDDATIEILSDDKDNRKIFKNGYLYQIKDANENTVTVKYGNAASSAIANGGIPSETNNRIVAVTQQIGGTNTEKTIATLTYNDNGYLIGISDENSNATSIWYDADRLVWIKTTDDQYMKYRYDTTTGDMTYAYDSEAQYGVKYDYAMAGKVLKITEFTVPSANFNSLTGLSTGAEYFLGTGKKQRSVVRYIGADRSNISEGGNTGSAWNTADDIVTTYLLDYLGRTVNTYSSNIKLEDYTANKSSTGSSYKQFVLYGTSVTKYTDTKIGSESRKNNRIESQAVTSRTPANFVANPGAHNAQFNEWTHTGTVYLSGVAHSGTNSFALDRTYSSNGNADMYQSVTLKRGTYTFSAYVKNTITSAAGKGAHISVNVGGTSFESRGITAASNAEIEGGWERLSVTFDVTAASASCVLHAKLDNAIGVAYFDDFQLEDGEGTSNVNLVDNNTFERTMSNYDWTIANGGANVTLTTEDSFSGQKSIKLTSNISGYCIAKNTVDINGTKKGEAFVLSGWAKANAVSYKYDENGTIDDGNDAPKFKLYAHVIYNEGGDDYEFIKFNPEVRGEWQYGSIVFTTPANKTVANIEVCCFYANNAGDAYFDNVTLTREASQTYRYNDKGELVAVNDTAVEGESTYSYDAATSNLTACTMPGRGTVTYVYNDAHNSHLATTIKNDMGTSSENDDITANVTYDAAGNTTSTRVTGGTLFTQTSATYKDNNYLESVTDATGNSVFYNYYTSGMWKNRLNTTTTPTSDTINSANSVTTYIYNAAGRNSLSYIAGRVSVGNSYENGLLSSVTRGGYYNGTGVQQTYSFAYDAWGNTTSISAGNAELASYEYEARNGRLIKMTYGNGTEVSYTYDNLDRVKTVSYNNTAGNNTNTLRYEYFYEASGALSRVEEYDSNTTVYYQYDSIGRLISQSKYSGNTLLDSEHFTYDEYNRDKTAATVANGRTNNATATYNTANGNLDGYSNTYTVGAGTNGDAFSYTYDSLNRVTGKDLAHHSAPSATLRETFAYKNLTGAQTTGLVSGITYKYGTESNQHDLASYTYTYDNIGNIKTVSDSSGVIAKYYYDVQNQLTIEENYSTNKTYEYVYDTFGNIRQKKTYNHIYYGWENLSYGTPDSTVAYSYTNFDFKDMLTSYNNTTISYDAIGNPLNWVDGSSLYWTDGRKLASRVVGADIITYTYNGDGLRTSKTRNGGTINYYYNGTQLAVQTWDNNSLHFIYDESGAPYAFVYNDGSGDTVYYYIKNLQGDIVKIVDANMNVKVNYTYDAWGKVLSVTGTLASTLGVTNPLRYRGYYYDNETGWYYLTTRYYDPSVARFLNEDGLVSTGTGFLGYNMFAYCNNNPVMFNDYTGTAQVATEISFVTVGAGAAISSEGLRDIVLFILTAGVSSIAGLLFTPKADPAPTPKTDTKTSGQSSTSDTKTKTKEAEKDVTLTKQQQQTIIYRYGGTNPGNLTPKQKDKYTGLSFSTIPMPGAAVTTMEAINQTGIVFAIRDGATHISIRPICGTIDDWINEGPNSIWTKAVKAVVIKWEG